MSAVLVLCGGIGILSLALLSLLRYAAHFFSVRGLGFGKLELLKLCSNPYNWKALTFESNDNSAFVMDLQHFPRFLCHIKGFKVSFSWSKIRIELDYIYVHVHSSILAGPSSETKTKRSITAGFLLRLLPRFEFVCRELKFYGTTGRMNDLTSLSVSRCVAKNVAFGNDLELTSHIEAFKLDQLVASFDSLQVIPVVSCKSLNVKLKEGCLDASFSDSCNITCSVQFLFFLSSAIKDITSFDPDLDDFNEENNPSSSSSPLSSPLLVRISVPQIQVKLQLPTTVADSKIFNHLVFCANKVDCSAYLKLSSAPKFTTLADSLRISAKYESEVSDCKQFCPIDRLLNRDFSHLAGKLVDLLHFDKITLCNWMASEGAPISLELIQKLFSSILEGNLLWNCNSTDIGDLDFKQSYSRQKSFSPSVSSFQATQAFYQQVHSACRTIFAEFASVQAFVPFEFPFSNLLDHSVVLFKAGWRPLSRKTERGYWSGDGDKFFGTDWRLSLHSKKVGFRFEDDQFEVRLSTIYHCQRKIAESRCRLESGFWEQKWHGPGDASTFEQTLAEHLTTTTSTSIPPAAVKPFIELNKTLFEQYREAIDNSRLASNYNLLEATIDDMELNLSWSPEFLQDRSLADLLNSMESGSFLNDDVVRVLSTFLGGFFDVKTGHVQLSLRNFSRPVLLAPESRLIGPLFLVEAPVRDPNVLVKLPVKVFEPNLVSNLPVSDAGTVQVLRSILPMKLYHCIHISVSSSQLCQFGFSPYWMGCLGLVDRAFDRFVKASTEDPSPPLPGWDKLRYNLRGVHSKISITAPLLVSCAVDSDPFVCNEMLEVVFPCGLDLASNSNGLLILKCHEATLGIKSLHLQSLNSAVADLSSISDWDSQCFSGAFANFNALPVIKLTKTHLQLRLDIKNQLGHSPCDHWNVSPVAKENLPQSTDFEHFDTFNEFRSRSISLHLSGIVGDSSLREQALQHDIRFLYYRELERWICRFLLAFHSDIDCVKQGNLHQCAAIPLRLEKTSFSSVFRQLHLSFEFDDLFTSRLINFSDHNQAQALWATAQGSALNMDWCKGQIDKHGKVDWCYYYGEIEFLDVQFCVNSFSGGDEEMKSADFGVKIPGVVFYELLRAPRLFYLSLDEKCFQFDPECMFIQCGTVSVRRRALLDNFANASKELNRCDPELDRAQYNRLVNTLIALQNRKRYFDSFLVKTNFDFGKSSYSMADLNSSSDLSDMSHFEIYNAQLVWHNFNRDIVFKLVDELFVFQKKKFSQNRSGLLLMKKMAAKANKSALFEQDQSVQSPLHSPASNAGSYCISPNEAIDNFFETLLERQASTIDPEKAPFIVKPEPLQAQQAKHEKLDLRSPGNMCDPDNIIVPRSIEVNFYNPQLHLFTPSLIPPGSIVIAAKEAKVEFSPLWDRRLYLLNLEKSENEARDDEKIGTRAKVSLKHSTFYSASSRDYSTWPSQVLSHCYLRDALAFEQILKRITEDTGVTLIYDVSNIGYARNIDSPKLENFGHGDSISFVTNGLSITTKSEQFRAFLDVIVNLLVYRDPNQELRAQKLETILIAANLSDRRTFTAKMLEMRCKMDRLRQTILHSKELCLTAHRLKEVLNDFDETERELAFLGDALRIIQASSETLNQKRSRLTLKVDIDRIQWTMLMPFASAPTLSPGIAPICNVALKGITSKWISKEDGSMEYVFEINSANFLNQLPNPFYRNVLRAFDVNDSSSGAKLKAAVNYGCLIRFFAKSRLPVNGIVVLDHVELDLSPLQLQLTLDIAQQIFKFFFPESIAKKKKKGNEDGDEESTFAAEPIDPGRLGRSNTVTGAQLERQQSFLMTRRERSETDLSIDPTTLLALEGGDEAMIMKARSQFNVFFVYVKVPASQHLLSYKGTGKTSIMDIDRFVLNLPEFEYQNKLWSWPEFFNQLRRDSIIVLLKNAGSLFKDKIKKLGRSNVPEDEQYIRNLALKERISLDDYADAEQDKESKNFLVFGKSLLKLMKK